MQRSFGTEYPGNRRVNHPSLEMEAEWSYLRANLDHPARLMGSRLGNGLASWLLSRLHVAAVPAPQLSILARIALGPRQSVALVEAEGVHLLVGTSADGPLSFHALPGSSRNEPESSRFTESSSPPGALAVEGMRGYRRAPETRIGGRKAGWSAAVQPANRLRLTGRVSWV